MKKICLNCKHCNYNRLKKEYESLNVFQKIFTGLRFEISIAKENPKCNHPEVHECSEHEELIFGNKRFKTIFCTTARTESSEYFKCCGKEGKYFERNEE